MKPDIYEHSGEGILCVYKNPKWLVSIKNWKPDNDIDGIVHLEVHHSTDEQFILAAGKAILITAERKEGRFEIQLTLMEQGKVYNVPAECWFYSITQKDTKMMYVRIPTAPWKTAISWTSPPRKSPTSGKTPRGSSPAEPP